jgi:transcriptional regulator with XRE-family HTH domain
MTTLTQTEADEFGRALRFIRDARRMTLREASKASTISYQYLHNIEEGTRTGYSDELVQQLQKAYRLPDRSLDDLLLRARVRSALSQRGISTSDTDAAWRMMEKRLNELGTPINTNLAALVADILGTPAGMREKVLA